MSLWIKNTVSERLFSSVEAYIDDHYIDDHKLQGRNRLLEESKSNYYEEALLESSRLEHLDHGKSPNRSLDDVVKHLDESFSEMLLRIIDEKGLKDPDVYKKANVTKQTFSKIRNNKHYNPTKQTVLAFAIALQLNLDEAKDLLLKSGYALSRSSRFDVIMSYFFESENYDIFEINEVLFAYDESLLGV